MFNRFKAKLISKRFDKTTLPEFLSKKVKLLKEETCSKMEHGAVIVRYTDCVPYGHKKGPHICLIIIVVRNNKKKKEFKVYNAMHGFTTLKYDGFTGHIIRGSESFECWYEDYYIANYE